MSDANESNSRQTLWRRLSPFLDVIGAVLIFGSWVLSHALSQRAQDEANIYQSIIGRVRQFRLYDDYAQRISAIQSDLVRTRNLVESAQQGAGTSRKGLTWYGMTPTQIRELNDFITDLERYASELATSPQVRKAVAEAQAGVGQLTQAFKGARVEFERLVELRARGESTADASPTAAEQQLRKEVDLLWANYELEKTNMLQAGDDLMTEAAAQSRAAKRLAWQCRQLSYVLYIVGTLIVLYGRAKSALSAKEKAAAPA